MVIIRGMSIQNITAIYDKLLIIEHMRIILRELFKNGKIYVLYTVHWALPQYIGRQRDEIK